MSIPEEIKKKIDDHYPSQPGKQWVRVLRDAKVSAASFGYQLAQEEIERLKRENDLLSEENLILKAGNTYLLNNIKDNPSVCRHSWVKDSRGKLYCIKCGGYEYVPS